MHICSVIGSMPWAASVRRKAKVIAMADQFSFHKCRLASPAFVDPRCQQAVSVMITDRLADFSSRGGGVEGVSVLEGSDVVVCIRAAEARDAECAAIAIVSAFYTALLMHTECEEEGLDEVRARILRYALDVSHHRRVDVSDVEWAAFRGAGRQPAN